MAGYTIVYITTTKVLLGVTAGEIEATIRINDEIHTAKEYADYDALLVGMDGLGIDYTTDWDRVFIPKIS